MLQASGFQTDQGFDLTDVTHTFLPKGNRYSSLTNFTFERGCDNWNKLENVKLQSERDPDSLLRREMWAYYGLVSQKEDPKRNAVPKLVTWL